MSKPSPKIPTTTPAKRSLDADEDDEYIPDPPRPAKLSATATASAGSKSTNGEYSPIDKPTSMTKVFQIRSKYNLRLTTIKARASQEAEISPVLPTPKKMKSSPGVGMSSPESELSSCQSMWHFPVFGTKKSVMKNLNNDLKDVDGDSNNNHHSQK